MQVQGPLLGKALLKHIALNQLLHRDVGGNLNHVPQGERLQPIAVGFDLNGIVALEIQDVCDLLAPRRRIGHDLISRELLPLRRLAGRITDPRSEIAKQKR